MDFAGFTFYLWIILLGVLAMGGMERLYLWSLNWRDRRRPERVRHLIEPRERELLGDDWRDCLRGRR